MGDYISHEIGIQQFPTTYTTSMYTVHKNENIHTIHIELTISRITMTRKMPMMGAGS